MKKFSILIQILLNFVLNGLISSKLCAKPLPKLVLIHISIAKKYHGAKRGVNSLRPSDAYMRQ